LQRTGPGFTYVKLTETLTKKPFSGNRNVVQRLVGSDSEDGSPQAINVLCNEGLCDIYLFDPSFSTCINKNGEIFGGGLAMALDIPQGSLDDFDLDLYCLIQPMQSGPPPLINYTAPAAQLTGDLVLLGDGTYQRTGTGPGFYYFDAFRPSSKSNSGLIENGAYDGNGFNIGIQQRVDVFCDNGICEVIFWAPVNLFCASGQSGRPIRKSSLVWKSSFINCFPF